MLAAHLAAPAARRPATSRALAPLVLALLVTSVVPSQAQAQAARLGGDAGRAAQLFDSAAELLKRSRSALEALETGREPRATAADLGGVTAAFEKAADALHRAEAPALADPTLFTVSADALRNCATRSGALAKVEQFRRELQAEIGRIGELRGLLRDRTTAAQAAEEDRRALGKQKVRLTGSPAGAEWFPPARADLDRPLALAIQACSAELKHWLDRADGVLGELRARAGAFATSAAEFGRLRDCALAGTWLGSSSLHGEVSGVSLRLAYDGARWSGAANVGGDELPVKSVTLQGSGVTILLGERTSLRGKISDDDQVLQATFSSIEGPAHLTLRKR